MPLDFVNLHGETIPEFVIAKGLDGGRAPAQKRDAPDRLHKGWKVTGVRMSALQEARAKAEGDASAAREIGREPKEWNEQQWLMNAKGKPIRSKPYEVPEAAEECKALAEKSGLWLRVQVIEIKKGQP